MTTTTADLASRLWVAMSPEEKSAFLAGSYTEDQASEWLGRVGQPAMPAGLYEAFEGQSHWDGVADAMVQIRLAEIR